jgi:hypothetical protein
MNVTGPSTPDPALQALQGASGVDNKRIQLQVALLRKTLDSQEQQAAELLRLMEGKGQNIDLRV